MVSFPLFKYFSCSLLILFSFAAVSGCSTTSIMRLQVNNDGTFTDFKQDLVWQQDKSRTILSSEQAMDYVKGLDFAGRNGWRLPTLEEFHNLYFTFDFGKKDQKKANYNLSGNFWVKDNKGKVMVGSWNDTSGGCCVIREFIPSKKGFVKGVRSAEAQKKQT